MDLKNLKPHEFARLKKNVAIELARITLASADFSQDLDLLTEAQLDAYLFVEMLWYDGELTYGQLWAMCPRHLLAADSF